MNFILILISVLAGLSAGFVFGNIQLQLNARKRYARQPIVIKEERFDIKEIRVKYEATAAMYLEREMSGDIGILFELKHQLIAEIDKQGLIHIVQIKQPGRRANDQDFITLEAMVRIAVPKNKES